jgi:hypothetical protein
VLCSLGVNGPLTCCEALLVASGVASDASFHALASDVSGWMDFLTWYDVPPEAVLQQFLRNRQFRGEKGRPVI